MTGTTAIVPVTRGDRTAHPIRLEGPDMDVSSKPHACHLERMMRVGRDGTNDPRWRPSPANMRRRAEREAEVLYYRSRGHTFERIALDLAAIEVGVDPLSDEAVRHLWTKRKYRLSIERIRQIHAQACDNPFAYLLFVARVIDEDLR